MSLDELFNYQIEKTKITTLIQDAYIKFINTREALQCYTIILPIEYYALCSKKPWLLSNGSIETSTRSYSGVLSYDCNMPWKRKPERHPKDITPVLSKSWWPSPATTNLMRQREWWLHTCTARENNIVNATSKQHTSLKL